MNIKTINKQITFSPKLYELGQTVAHELGLSFSEYVRHLLVKDVEKQNSEYMRMKQVVDEARKDFKDGKTMPVKSVADIEKLL